MPYLSPHCLATLFLCALLLAFPLLRPTELSMPLLNSAIPLFAFAALVISEDCCSVASLNYSMPPLLSVTLCRCYAHIFCAPPLPIIEVPCFALAIITWRSTQCLCPASPSIRYHAVAAQGFSQPGLAVASQCNALRALPLHNCSLPLLYQSSPSQVITAPQRELILALF